MSTCCSKRSTSATDLAVEIHEAVVSYREDVALRGVSLAVRRGEFVGIVGPNGAGKTTLLTVVNGLANLLQGEVCVLGERLSRKSAGRIRTRVGYVPQSHGTDPRMPVNVREVVMIGRYGRLGLLRRPGPADWQIVYGMLRLVGMHHLADRPIGHLSGGQQQRVAIARALAQEPEILLLDEPTAGLDWRAQREILDLVRSIHDTKGLTTLFVTHDLLALPRACDRVVILKEGRIWREGEPESVLSPETLAALFGAQAGFDWTM
ncbi:MAG: ABC transporter ATP-binding protein [Dehalococcoidales bacterium]|nr:ABC transporter ATP-binding protein [Dehalococcoidales bacterium]